MNQGRRACLVHPSNGGGAVDVEPFVGRLQLFAALAFSANLPRQLASFGQRARQKIALPGFTANLGTKTLVGQV